MLASRGRAFFFFFFFMPWAVARPLPLRLGHPSEEQRFLGGALDQPGLEPEAHGMDATRRLVDLNAFSRCFIAIIGMGLWVQGIITAWTHFVQIYTSPETWMGL